MPLLGAYTTFNIASALPPLGGALFPIADNAALLAWIVAGTLVLKVLLEEVASRWFPERMATVTPVELPWPGTAQMVVSALLRVAVFLFISAAFVGTPWQLWVAGALYLLPVILVPFSYSWPNSSRLWQVLPQSMPYLAVALLVYLVLSGVLLGAFGDSVEFALMAFFILMIPDFILGIAALFGREPVEGDVRWYLRPTMVGVYRIGGIAVLAIATYLAWRSLG